LFLPSTVRLSSTSFLSRSISSSDQGPCCELEVPPVELPATVTAPVLPVAGGLVGPPGFVLEVVGLAEASTVGLDEGGCPGAGAGAGCGTP
jgi:hypothetical protein